MTACCAESRGVCYVADELLKVDDREGYVHS
jgi:hypothetical protein